MRVGSFEQRLEPMRERLLRYAFALTRDRDEARDLFQETVARALSAAEMPSDDSAFRAWLFRIVRNIWIDRGRAGTRRDMMHRTIAIDRAQEAAQPAVETNIVVREAFSCLSIEHQEVLALVDIAGFSYEETGELLAIPKGTVMSRVTRARQNLFHLLSSDTVVPMSRQRVRRGR